MTQRVRGMLRRGCAPASPRRQRALVLPAPRQQLVLRTLASQPYYGRRGKRPPPRDQTATDGRVKHGPLAIPFGVATKDDALKAFDRWRSNQGGVTFDSSAITTRAIKPVYLPFFAFDGQLSATFTGELGYTTSSSYRDANGKRHRVRKTDWYSKENMRVGPRQVDPSVQPKMMQYTGFAYRREYVHQAMDTKFARMVDSARPLHAGMLPVGVGVHEFEAKPSFSYAAAASTFESIAMNMALEKLHDPGLNEQFTATFGWGTACPASDWTQPDRYEVSSLYPSLSNARLYPKAGVFLAPFWI